MREIGDDAMAVLQAHSWPGNVRQLRNIVERLLILATDDRRRGDHRRSAAHRSRRRRAWGSGKGGDLVISLPLREAREIFERDYLLAQINRFGGNISRTAAFIGMERSALHRKLKSLGVGSNGASRVSTREAGMMKWTATARRPAASPMSTAAICRTARPACISRTAALQLGDGIYEVCGIADGRLLDEEEHLDRLERSLARDRDGDADGPRGAEAGDARNGRAATACATASLYAGHARRGAPRSSHSGRRRRGPP